MLHTKEKPIRATHSTTLKTCPQAQIYATGVTASGAAKNYVVGNKCKITPRLV